MKVTIINIGDELLIGQVVNTNASTMCKMLTDAGMEVASTLVVGDNRQAILDAIRRAMPESDAVLLTGGLGPTKDDITKTTLCDFFGTELVEDSMALENVRRLFDGLGYEVTPVNRAQALVPKCCTVINNDLGTAPCMWFEAPSEQNSDSPCSVLVAMPGVPFEMEWLMANRVIPKLLQHFSAGAIINKNILVQGIGESFLSDLIEEWEQALPPFIRLAYLPQAGMVKLRLTARGDDRKMLEECIMREVKKLYLVAGQYIVGEDLETLPEAVARAFSLNVITLATAESCTGGAIASKLTALPGASCYMKGGVVAYSNEVKEQVLGVQHTTLEHQGAVSEETVRQMAEGVRRLLHTDYGVATSGIAGPSGGTPDKPVGTVWMAVAGPKGTTTRLKHFGTDRLRTIERACNEIFAMLLHEIKK